MAFSTSSLVDNSCGGSPGSVSICTVSALRHCFFPMDQFSRRHNALSFSRWMMASIWISSFSSLAFFAASRQRWRCFLRYWLPCFWKYCHLSLHTFSLDRICFTISGIGYIMTCSSPRRPLFLHALSFQCTSKLCSTFLNQFSDYFHIKKMHNTI